MPTVCPPTKPFVSAQGQGTNETVDGRSKDEGRVVGFRKRALWDLATSVVVMEAGPETRPGYVTYRTIWQQNNLAGTCAHGGRERLPIDLANKD